MIDLDGEGIASAEAFGLPDLLDHTLALVGLYTRVKQRFIDDAAETGGALVNNHFGWRKPKRQSRTAAELANRIDWVPGDPTGKAGKIGSAVRPGREIARPLATLVEVFTVYVYAYDKTKAESELAQYVAARTLFDYWYRTMYFAAADIGSRARVLPLDLAWEIEKVERPHGACLRGVFTIDASILDEIRAFAPVDTSATFEGDLDETSDGETHVEPNEEI